jgi:hypothetical protein
MGAVVSKPSVLGRQKASTEAGALDGSKAAQSHKKQTVA